MSWDIGYERPCCAARMALRLLLQRAGRARHLRGQGVLPLPLPGRQMRRHDGLPPCSLAQCWRQTQFGLYLWPMWFGLNGSNWPMRMPA